MWSPFWKLSAAAVILHLNLLSHGCGGPCALRASQSGPAGTALPAAPHPLTRSSGYIFAGTVKSVERAAPKGHGLATVLINFHVDQAMRGVRTGQMLAIREWAGLWESGERYRPGERVLLVFVSSQQVGVDQPGWRSDGEL